MTRRSRYVMGDDGNPTKFIDIDTYYFGEKKDIDIDTYYFGEKKDIKVPAAKDRKDQQLSVSVASDGDTVWIQGRRDEFLQMTREEAMEMISILNKRFPLDALGQA